MLVSGRLGTPGPALRAAVLAIKDARYTRPASATRLNRKNGVSVGSAGHVRHLTRSWPSFEETSTVDSGSQPAPSSTAPNYVRKSGSFYISNVLPIRLGRFDPRHLVAALEEDALLERLEAIAQDVVEEEKHASTRQSSAAPAQNSSESNLITQRGSGFRVEGWEIARKDGGIFLNYSYRIPIDLGQANLADAVPPPKLLLAKLTAAAKRRGGFPSWLGNWWATATLSKAPDASSVSDRLDATGRPIQPLSVPEGTTRHTEDVEDPSFYETRAERKRRLMLESGDGRLWNVKGRQWTEDMNRFPSNRVRVEFEGPDVSQEVLYELFRPYGRLADITPPAPVPAGNLRFAIISYTRLKAAAIAVNTLHGLPTPTNSRDFVLINEEGEDSPKTSALPRTRLRLFYERPLKAHAIRDWISGHPRIVIPVAAFLLGTLSYTLFDPIRAFFVRAHVEGYWDIEGYSLVRWFRSKLAPTGLTFSFGKKDEGGDSGNIGQNAWKDRVESEKQMVSWLNEYPSTFITVSGPPGSGKGSLVSRVIGDQSKRSLRLDCSKIAKAKTDTALVNELASQTGYYPVFSFMNQFSGLIDLAAVGLIGQKAGFATPVDQQLKQVLEVVGASLKDISDHNREERIKAVEHQKERAERKREEAERSRLISLGAWHDGRLDCVAGNGIMSELGFGVEDISERDTQGEVEASATSALLPVVAPTTAVTPSEVDQERDFVQSLPILVLDNFTQKAAGKTELWSVLAEWGANLVENKIAHVIVISDSSSALKSLTKALPSKPLNSISLADADMKNSMAYVTSKLGIASVGQQQPLLPAETTVPALSVEDTALVEKIGGRMIDLETLVYKVRTGMTLSEAVDDIINRNVIELRKSAFGDDSEDAKSLPWTRAQAWKVVSALAEKGEISYAALLQDYPFKGSEGALKALEAHDLVQVSYVDGRPSMVRPGKPVFRHAFGKLVEDPVFRATCSIEYTTPLISKADTDIRALEAELLQLGDIFTKLSSTSNSTRSHRSWLDLIFGTPRPPSADATMSEREYYLLAKMDKLLRKLVGWESEVDECKKVLTGAR